MLSDVERKYCEKCSSSSSCGYTSRGLESKCEQLSTYMDGYEDGYKAALNSVRNQLTPRLSNDHPATV